MLLPFNTVFKLKIPLYSNQAINSLEGDLGKNKRTFVSILNKKQSLLGVEIIKNL